MKHKINARLLIAELGGAKAVLNALQNDGHDVSIKAVEKWSERKALPMRWWLVLRDLPRKDGGRRLSLDRYLMEGGDNDV